MDRDASDGGLLEIRRMAAKSIAFVGNIARAAVVLRCPPARLEQSLVHQAKQAGRERALFDRQGIAGDLPDA